MSDTYIGWDGKSYPWPPPDGWYHASDGRWWAPSTGPNPPPAAAPSRFEHTAPLDHTSQYPEHERPGHGDSGRRYAEHDYRDHDAYGAHETELLTPATAAVGASATPSYFDDPAHLPPPGPASQLPPPGPSGLSGPGGPGLPDLDGDDGGDPYHYGVPSAAAGPGGEGGLGPKKLVIGVAAVLAVVAIGVSAFLLRNGDDTATDTNATVATVAGAPASTAATLPAASTPASVADPNATTTVAPTDPAAASSTLAEGDAALVAGFRALLVQQGLTSDKLSDTDIQSFAASFCVFAKSSDNIDEFNVFREQAISETKSALEPASLNKVIDAAVITFCPEEATRLGITLG